MSLVAQRSKTCASRSLLPFRIVHASTAGGFVGPFGGSLLVAKADLRLIFVLSGAMILAFTAWLAHALRVPHRGPAAVAEVGESPSGMP